MPAKTNQVGAAAQYAKALLELGNERQQAEAIGQELAAIKEAIEANPTFAVFLRDPGIGENDRGQTLERVFSGKASPLVMNTMRVLNGKGRLGLLTGIAQHYHEMLDEQLGKIEVDVIVPQRMDGEALEQVKQRISRALKKDATVRQQVDESIIGGLVLRIEDKLIDASVKAQLEAMREKMLNAAPR